MKLKYLEYLRCHCGSGRLAPFRLVENIFTKLSGADGATVIETGFLLCESCARLYPVNNGILKMLPDELYDRGTCGFMNRYRTILPAALGWKPSGAAAPRKEEAADTTLDKKNEMQERDRQAEDYHRYGYWLYGRNEEAHFIRTLNVSAEDLVVDLGCGTGRITSKLMGAGFSGYIAIDFSEKSLELFSEKLDGKMRDDILLLHGDVCNLPLKDRVADKALSAQVFEHIPGQKEQTRFIEELKRVLKRDGLAALSIYNFNLRKRIFKKYSKKGFHNGGIYYENFKHGEILKLFRPYLAIKKLSGINCYVPFIKRFSVGTQKAAESILAKTGLGRYLGEILFVVATPPQEKRAYQR